MVNVSLENYLSSKKCFKLILGANNENYDEITKLTALYSKAGCRFFDINASIEAIKAAKEGFKFSKKEDCFLCISVGGKNDIHISKCRINQNKCVQCRMCMNECIQNAIVKNDENKIIIEEKKCIGCARCMIKCPNVAIERYFSQVNFNKRISELKKYCDCIELHIASENLKDVEKKWDFLCRNFNSMLSISVSRLFFSDELLIKQLKKMLSRAPLNKVMIQADGISMSGGKNDFNTTLQAISCADLILKSKISCPIIISGGTNAKSKELAKLCDVNISGVAVGSYARKIVKEYVENKDFLRDEKLFNSALEVARNLVQSVME